jgi:hypothetical protein
MAYVAGNPKTKKMLKEWLSSGRAISIFQPGLGTIPHNGTISVEGPHYPEPHRWYASVTIKDGKVVKVS